MKKVMLVILLFLTKLNSFSQNEPIRKCGIYQNNFASSSSLTPSPSNNQNEISINGGQLRFNNVPGSPRDVRLSRSLGTTLGNSWSASFSFSITNVGTSGGALLPFVITAGNLAPSNPENQPTVQTNQDAIGVTCITAHNQTNPITIRPYVKNGTNAIGYDNCSAVIQLNTNYNVQIERVSYTKGRFIVSNNGNIIQNCCFDIPMGVDGLTFIQAANAVQADQNRRISGFADNFCISNSGNLSCCIKEIEGISQICSTIQSATYTIEGSPSTNYIWTLPAGITFTGQGTNSITITSWGTFLGNVNISVSRECNCQIYSSVFSVDVRQNLYPFTLFEKIGEITNGNLITEIKVQVTTPTPAFGGFVNWWNIYEASNGNPTDFSILNENTTPVELRATGFGQQYTITTPPTPDILKTKFYIIKHGMYYENGVCGWQEKRMKILTSGGNFKVYIGDGKNSKSVEYQNQMLNSIK